MTDDKNIIPPEAEKDAQPQNEQTNEGENSSQAQGEQSSAGENAAPLHTDQAQSETDESAITQDKADDSQDINPAEFAESLTPGEETLFTESEQNVADIETDLEKDADAEQDATLDEHAAGTAYEHAEAAKERKHREKAKLDTSSGVLYYLRVAGTLTAICACIALLLAFVNNITSKKIADNNRKVAEAAIQAIFTDFDSSEPLEGEFPLPVTGITAVNKGGMTIGYCIFTSTKGFGGQISLAVGVRVNETIAGVKVLGMSETPGLGTRTGEDSFLSQFTDKTADITLGGNIDAVAGATISSNAVFAGVKAAAELVSQLPAPAYTDSGETSDATAGATDETDATAGATAGTDTAETTGAAETQAEETTTATEGGAA